MDAQFIILVIVGILAVFYAVNQFRNQFSSSDKSGKCSKCPAVDETKKNGSN